MKTVVAVLLCVALAAPVVQAMAQTVPDATTLSMRGTLDGYDATRQIVLVMTRSGTVRLTLVATTRIRQGRREIEPVALARLNGYQAVVRYSESAGIKILQSIHVLDKKETVHR
jgi:hypothetical protein